MPFPAEQDTVAEPDAPEPAEATVPAVDPPAVPVTPADAELASAPHAGIVAEPEKAPPPIPTGFPEPATTEDAAGVQSGGITVTETGTAVFPQPMEPAREGHVNLATVPPMTHLFVPPLEDGGETVTIDVYGTEVDDATAERAYAAAQAAGLTLREL